MDLTIPRIYGSLPTNLYNDICGCSSEKFQQFMVTAFSPRVSVLSSELADDIARQFGDIQNVCHLVSYFENCLAFGATYNQKINTRINSKNTTTLSSNGCVRFVPDVLGDYKSSSLKSWEPQDIENYKQDLKSYIKAVDESIQDLSGDLNYDSYRSNYNAITKLQNSIYLKFHSLLYRSSMLSPFECFSHPIAQVIVVSGYDSIENINLLLSSIKNVNIPQWIDISVILQHVIVLVNHDDPEMLQNALRLQETLKVKLGITSAIVPLDLSKTEINEDDPSNLKLYPSVYTHNEEKILTMNKESYESWKRPLQELISRNLITFMNLKIKSWTEEIVQPRTSFTGRIFGAKKWTTSTKTNFFSFGSSNNTQDVSSTTQKPNFNMAEGYYDAKSSEMILRRLGDWYFILGDFKNAQNVYELVKKDMLNDKAYTHVASINEFIVYSHLLNAVNDSEVNLTTKILTGIIRPMIDSAFYTYLSRSNLKFQTIRMTLTSAELLLLLGQTILTSSKKIDQVSELCLNEATALLSKVIDSKLISSVTSGYLMQRIAFIFGSYNTVKHYSYQEMDDPYYDEENLFKTEVGHPRLENIGLTRFRKQELWLLLSAKELDIGQQPLQSKLIMWKIHELLDSGVLDKVTTDWLRDRHSLLYKIECRLTMN